MNNYPIPRLIDVGPEMRKELFRRKLQLCTIIIDFSDPSVDRMEKDLKTNELKDLIQFVSNTQNLLADQSLYQTIFEMISANLLRCLPPRMGPVNPDEDELIYEVAWPHIELVYEFFLACLESLSWNSLYAAPYLNNSFTRELLKLFNAEDPNERVYLKNVLHKIYGTTRSLRSFIRSEISNTFLEFSYENAIHNGIAELLSVLDSIIDGFIVPLRDEHKDFCTKTLVKLYRSASYRQFHAQLTSCINKFIQKDQQLIPQIFDAILKFWPKTQTEKQVSLLRDIPLILQRIPNNQFEAIELKLFHRIGQCIASDHFGIAETALTLFSSESVIIPVADNIHVILPLIFGPLSYSSQVHWQSRTRVMCASILQLFAEIDPERYLLCYQFYTMSNKSEKEKWIELERQASKWRQDALTPARVGAPPPNQQHP
eukprot:TRINITY_DN7902_c0_g2_i1.p1 TRINITY_DN7902_c0_g2~~TRINITY_DN7902_c0_g2_i1.p1  ORF type:complete len:429 (+),score=124.53 TRINITY_DN7902_c0_g2_i1:749-2035(+)